MEKINSLMMIKMAFLFVVFCNAVVDVAHKVLLQNIAFKIFDGSAQVIWISIINAMIILPFLLLFHLFGFRIVLLDYGRFCLIEVEEEG